MKSQITFRAVPAIVAAAAAVVNSAVNASPADAAGVFQPYKDTKLGFALAKPDGWTVQTSDNSITVASPDKSELLLTEMFHAAPGDTAAQWLDKFSYKYAALFPQAAVDNVTQQHAKGDEIIAALHYQGPHGPAQLRALCSIVNGKGMLYVMAAPADRFTAERPRLLHVAQSLVFTVPRGGGSPASGNGGGTGDVTASQIASTIKAMHWTTWSDPREHAFHISVPKGWTVQGGMFRDGETTNIYYLLVSPQKDIVISVGSPRYLTFTTLSQTEAAVGMRDGQNGVLHYMRAPEFNEMYLREIVSKAVDDLKPGKGQEAESLTRQVNEQLKHQYGGLGMNTVASVGVTDFKGTNKETGKPIGGIVMSQTMAMQMPGPMNLPTTWFAQPMLVASQSGDAAEQSRVRTAMAVFEHTQQTLKDYPEWDARRQQELDAQAQDNIEHGKQIVAAAGDRSRQIAANSSAAEDAIMGRYESHRAAQDNAQRGFINYIGDRTDVTDGAGHAANVASGYGHYYRNDRTGTIMGTNSAYSPGVDFSPLSQY